MSLSNRVGGAVVRTLLLTDLVDSTRLIERIGDVRASEVLADSDRIARDLLVRFNGTEIDKTDGFLFLFERPIDAVRYALAYHTALGELESRIGASISSRAGIHLGEVVLRRNAPQDVELGAKPVEVDGLAKHTAARVMSLAGAKQTLLTRGAFDLSRRATVGEPALDEEIQWLAHGQYRFKGVSEPMEIFEVGRAGFAPLAAPPDSEKAGRALTAADALLLGWRPAAGLEVPHRSNWVLRDKLGEGGFGETWLAANGKTGEQRTFKFCLDAERLRALRREVSVFRLMRELLGNRDDIGRILDWQFDEAPYFLESEWSEDGNFIEWAERQGGLDQVPLSIRLELIARLADALAAAHSVGVLHKDLKPASILIATDRNGVPKVRLMDFGLGAIQDTQIFQDKGITFYSMTDMFLPKSDSTTGNAHLYMAPELIEGNEATVQTDIFALGVMLYQVVVGDFGRALASGWERNISDELLREEISSLVDGSSNRRKDNALEVADHLRRLPERSVVAWIGAEMEFALSKAVASGDTFEHRPSECGHCVQDFLADLDLRDLPGEAARFELGADDALPPADLRFYPAALVVPCGHLPGHAAVAADLGNMAIPNGWIPRRLRSDHCVLWRRYNHIQGLPIPFPQQIPCGRSIIGAVRQKARDRGIELIQEPGQGGAVSNVIVSQIGANNRTASPGKAVLSPTSS